MMRVVLKDGRCAELVNGVSMSIEAIDAGAACDDGREHLLGHYTAAELRGFVVSPVPDGSRDAARWGPDAGTDPILDLG